MSAEKGPQDLVNGVWFMFDPNVQFAGKQPAWYVEPLPNERWRGWYIYLQNGEVVSEWKHANTGSPDDMRRYGHMRVELPLTPRELQVSEGL